MDAYYAAAAADDGAKACSLVYSLIEESVAEDYGEPPGPPNLSGRTCAAVMTKLFKQVPGQPPTALAKTRVTGVHIEGRLGLVQLTSPTMPSGDIQVELEHGVWKVTGLIGQACRRCPATGRPPAPASPTAIAAVSGGAIGNELAYVIGGPSSPPSPSRPGEVDANDEDEDRGSHDDATVLDYGQPASASDRKAVTALVKRYYEAAASGDAVSACALVYSLVAEAFAEQGSHLSSSGKGTCASVLAREFSLEHRRLVADARSVQVLQVRVNGERAIVLMRLLGGSLPRHLAVHREGRLWKVEQPIDNRMP